MQTKKDAAPCSEAIYGTESKGPDSLSERKQSFSL